MIHIQIHQAAANAVITDMTNAGKRGKRCDSLRFRGFDPAYEVPPERQPAVALTWDILAKIKKLTPADDFAAVVTDITAQIEAAKVDPELVRVAPDSCRGVDSPRVRLLAGLEGQWHGYADENGISLSDETDKANEPAMITRHDQKNSRAYELAAKVWENVKAAQTFSEAGNILSAAGCSLHYYCRMD